MSLTYQPFADTPEVVELGRELNKNISDAERVMSMGLAGALFFAGLRSRGILSLALCVGAAALGVRAVTAHCPAYYRAGMSTRPSEESGPPAGENILAEGEEEAPPAKAA
jgi:hypothetical protein